jgi:type I restriction enzyme S subunit
MSNHDLIKLKYVAKSLPSSLKLSDVLETGDYPVYGASGLVGYLNEYGFDNEYIGIIKDGAGVGRNAIFRSFSSVLATMAYIVPRDEKLIDLKFLKYSLDGLDLANSIGDKATIPHIYFSEYGNKKVINLKIASQKKIASFLDNKINVIDELVSNQEKQIEILNEYKQSLISEVVTKGLDPNVPIKDSGIEWIGQIPKHWGILRNKYIMFKSKQLIDRVNDYPVLSLTMKGVVKRDLENPSGKMPATFDGYQIVKPNNLLLCLFDIDVTPRCVGLIKEIGITSPAYSQFCLYSINNPQYYEYLLRYIDDHKIYLHLSKNLRSSLTEELFGYIKSIQPPLVEQNQIVEYLDKKCEAIEKLLILKNQKIKKLNEYKKSLIYEYVTGKRIIES